jgi:O-antigen/teichoic acid export membrane protein
LRAISFNIIQPFKLKFTFDKTIARELFGYGKWMVIGSLIYWAYSYLDNAVVGKVLGATILGFYMVAYRWGNWIVDNIVMVLSPVLFPTFSRIQNNVSGLRKSYLEVLKYISLVIFPMTFGLIFLANEFVLNVMGKKWAPVIVPLQILAFGGLCRALQSVGGSIFLAVGKPKVSTYFMGINLTIILLLIYPFLLWKGIVGVSLAVTLAFIITFFIAVKLTSTLLEMSWFSMVQVWRNPFLAGLAMGAVLLISKNYFPSSFASFLILVGLGGSVYVALIYALTRGRIYREVSVIVKEVIHRR